MYGLLNADKSIWIEGEGRSGGGGVGGGGGAWKIQIWERGEGRVGEKTLNFA